MNWSLEAPWIEIKHQMYSVVIISCLLQSNLSIRENICVGSIATCTYLMILCRFWTVFVCMWHWVPVLTFWPQVEGPTHTPQWRGWHTSAPESGARWSPPIPTWNTTRTNKDKLNYGTIIYNIPVIQYWNKRIAFLGVFFCTSHRSTNWEEVLSIQGQWGESLWKSLTLVLCGIKPESRDPKIWRETNTTSLEGC